MLTPILKVILPVPIAFDASSLELLRASGDMLGIEQQAE